MPGPAAWHAADSKSQALQDDRWQLAREWQRSRPYDLQRRGQYKVTTAVPGLQHSR